MHEPPAFTKGSLATIERGSDGGNSTQRRKGAKTPGSPLCVLATSRLGVFLHLRRRRMRAERPSSRCAVLGIVTQPGDLRVGPTTIGDHRRRRGFRNSADCAALGVPASCIGRYDLRRSAHSAFVTQIGSFCFVSEIQRGGRATQFSISKSLLPGPRCQPFCPWSVLPFRVSIWRTS
jgi:hypothetical protein